MQVQPHFKGALLVLLALGFKATHSGVKKYARNQTL